MENRDWTAELRRLISKRLAWVALERGNPAALDAALDKIMADVEVYGVLKAREGYTKGAVEETQNGTSTFVDYLRVTAAPEHFPLPARTRQVLREEPIPGTTSPRYRFSKGELEAQGWRQGDAGWGEWFGCSNRAITIAHIEHFYDVAHNPYRTEQVPVDENNPWPDTEEGGQ
jgi:hypothetical protein